MSYGISVRGIKDEPDPDGEQDAGPDAPDAGFATTSEDLQQLRAAAAKGSGGGGTGTKASQPTEGPKKTK